jgi:hypothetical protein
MFRIGGKKACATRPLRVDSRAARCALIDIAMNKL